jgi:Flp pilus assembly protein TadG
MNLQANTSRIRNQSGQAALEFALVVPLLLAFLFLIIGFARVFNTYNDLNQMAAAGARLAAVGSFPGATALVQANADTSQSQSATIVGPTYSSGTCTVGGTVTVTAQANVNLVPFLPYINTVIPGFTNPLKGTAQMRVEQC